MSVHKVALSVKILLLLIALLTLVSCKKVHQPALQPNTGNILLVELRMPEPWKKIVIGPTNPIEYPKIPQRFSMFMTGESTGALKPYLLIEDRTGKEYSNLLNTGTHANKSQTEPLVFNSRHGNLARQIWLKSSTSVFA